MNEIANCPLCGKAVKQSIWRPEYESCGGSVVVTVKCCGIEAASIQLWNQYAAAMELAKAEVAASNAIETVPLDRLEAALEASESMVFDAKMRVLEVFK